MTDAPTTLRPRRPRPKVVTLTDRAANRVREIMAKAEKPYAGLRVGVKNGGCGLLTVELDRRPGEETPRVTVKRIQPFETLATSARMVIELLVADPSALKPIAQLVAGARGGRGELRLRAPLPDGGEARVLLGRDFLLDAELAAGLEAMHGIADVAFKTSEMRLALVG